MKTPSLTQAVRYALVAGAASAISAPAVFAQQAPAASTSAAPSTAQLGKIEVTGTRIKRTDVETAQPVTIITAAEIKATGLHVVGDILQQHLLGRRRAQHPVQQRRRRRRPASTCATWAPTACWCWSTASAWTPASAARWT